MFNFLFSKLVGLNYLNYDASCIPKQELDTINDEVPLFKLDPELLYIILSNISGSTDQVHVLSTSKKFSILGKEVFTHKNLMNAIMMNDLEAVKLLLSNQKVDPSANNNEAIIEASSKDRFKIVKKLLKDQRIDPTEGNNKALVEACKNGHAKVVRMLLKNDAVKKIFITNETIIGNSISREYALEPIKAATDNRHGNVLLELLTPQEFKEHAQIETEDFKILDTTIFGKRVRLVEWLK